MEYVVEVVHMGKHATPDLAPSRTAFPTREEADHYLRFTVGDLVLRGFQLLGADAAATPAVNGIAGSARFTNPSGGRTEVLLRMRDARPTYD